MSAVQEIQDGASAVAAGASAVLAAEAINQQWAKGDRRNWLKIARTAFSLAVAVASAYGAYQSLRRSLGSSSQS